jgi:hypothetical protein
MPYETRLKEKRHKTLKVMTTLLSDLKFELQQEGEQLDYKYLQ